jgi:hypothetical protein
MLPVFYAMKVKFTDWYDSINIRIPEMNFDHPFRRNTWVEVPEFIATELLKSPMFVCEADLQFDSRVFLTPGNFAINRFGALGDLIQLLPVVRHLKLSGHKFSLYTQQQYVSIFSEIGIFESVNTSGSLDKRIYDRVFYLDGVLENDHDLQSPDRLKHRIHIYEEFFGIKITNYDFSIPVSLDTDEYSRRILNAADK